jgi:hypothetical protein
MRLTFLKGITLGAIVAVATLSTTTALAGTGIGAVFNLGGTNRVNASSSLQGSASGPTLKLANAGSGAALGLQVAAGKAPFTVNSATQVANLNASLLDGVAATGFVQGGGQARSFGFTLTGSQSNVKLLSVPGYGELTATCTEGIGGTVFYFNLSSSVESVWGSVSGNSLGPFVITLGPSQGFAVLSPSVSVGQADVTIHYSTASGPLVFQHVATAEVQEVYEAGPSSCDFVAHGMAGPASLLP